jgi:hypothetical protein
MNILFKESMMLDIETNKPNNLLPYFILLLALFLFRFIAQLLQYFFDLQFLPPFESWDSGTLPYKILIVLQLLIVFVLSKTIYKIASDKIKPNIKTAYTLITFGILYFAIMLFRLIGGLTFIMNVKWFSYPIPSFFHLVLASFLILFGYFHLSNSGGELKNA